MVPEDNVALIMGDCAGAFHQPDDFPNQLVEGNELHRYMIQDPAALCNDGTPAVMYVRPATSETLANVWQIHLQGGGGCENWEDCAIRWCGAGYYDASKMSSNWTPDHIEGFGITDADTDNLLAEANHAYFYYCSSDNWAGMGQTHYTDTTGQYGDFSMYRNGHLIVEAGIRELMAGVTGAGNAGMPSLMDASIVVFNGTSAGSRGAQTNIDWLSDELSPYGVRVLGIFDAANNPPTHVLPVEVQDPAEEVWKNLWESERVGADVVPFMDASCLSFDGGTENEYRCGTGPYVMFNHITTPFFVRQDLTDLTGLAEALAIPEDDYEAYTRSWLLDLENIPDNAVETVLVTPGAYGPNCAQHVGMETNDWWRVATVAGEDGVDYTFQNAVWSWYNGNLVQIVDDPVVGSGTGPRSVCAAADGEH